MMYFLAGFIVGSIPWLFTLIFLTWAITCKKSLAQGIEKLDEIIESRITLSTKKEDPEILEPTTLEDQAVEDIIEENDKKGRDTNLAEEL